MKYVYEKADNGQAVNGRLAWDVYQLKPNEIAISELEAEDNMDSLENLSDIEYLQNIAIKKIKLIAYQILKGTDYIHFRHQEEIARGLMTTLSIAAYNDILAQRQATRDMSNQKESDIMELSKDDLLTYDITSGW